MDHPQDPESHVLKMVDLSTDEASPPPLSPTPSPTPPPSFPKKRSTAWIKITLVILVLLIGLAVAITLPALKVISNAQDVLKLAQETYTLGKNQDLVGATKKLEDTKSQLERTQAQYRILGWTQFIPFLGAYWKDGNRALTAALAGIDAADILGKAIEPYADVLGFKGQGSFMGGTAEDRIVTAVKTLEKVTPEIDKVAAKLKIADEALAQINPKRYPTTIRGVEVRSLIDKAKSFSHDAVVAVTEARPVIELLPQVMGVDGTKKYLVLFQNDAEIRATGGFMTAYSILRVENGRVNAEKSDDIYTLDDKFKLRVQSPEAIEKYLPLVFYWHLRDMNLSPDFKVSMDTFSQYYKQIPGEPGKELTGIFTVDTKVLKDLIDVLGPIEVPGYGTFSSEIDPECNCPQVIYQLELLADKPVATTRNRRKDVLGPMMQTILLKAYGAPKQTWPNLFGTLIRDIQEKHMLFYFFDDKFQAAAEGVKVAGRIRDYSQDYFHLNDTNFGGAKSNMFVEQSVDQEITVDSGGTVTKKVTVTYKNPQPPSNCNLEAGQLCLNGILRDYVRLYVPKGSTLQQSLGFEEGTPKTYEDLGKTIFEGFFKLAPQSQAKIIFSYTLPFKVTGKDYQLLIQKQPGAKQPHYTLTVNGTVKEFDLTTDTETTIPLR